MQKFTREKKDYRYKEECIYLHADKLTPKQKEKFKRLSQLLKLNNTKVEYIKEEIVKLHSTIEAMKDQIKSLEKEADYARSLQRNERYGCSKHFSDV